MLMQAEEVYVLREEVAELKEKERRRLAQLEEASDQLISISRERTDTVAMLAAATERSFEASDELESKATEVDWYKEEYETMVTLLENERREHREEAQRADRRLLAKENEVDELQLQLVEMRKALAQREASYNDTSNADVDMSLALERNVADLQARYDEALADKQALQGRLHISSETCLKAQRKLADAEDLNSTVREEAEQYRNELSKLLLAAKKLKSENEAYRGGSDSAMVAVQADLDAAVDEVWEIKAKNKSGGMRLVKQAIERRLRLGAREALKNWWQETQIANPPIPDKWECEFCPAFFTSYEEACAHEATHQGKPAADQNEIREIRAEAQQQKQHRKLGALSILNHLLVTSTQKAMVSAFALWKGFVVSSSEVNLLQQQLAALQVRHGAQMYGAGRGITAEIFVSYELDGEHIEYRRKDTVTVSESISDGATSPVPQGEHDQTIGIQLRTPQDAEHLEAHLKIQNIRGLGDSDRLQKLMTIRNAAPPRGKETDGATLKAYSSVSSRAKSAPRRRGMADPKRLLAKASRKSEADRAVSEEYQTLLRDERKSQAGKEENREAARWQRNLGFSKGTSRDGVARDGGLVRR